MNAPPHAGSIHDISRLFGGMDSSYSQTAAVSVHKQGMDSLWAAHPNLRHGP